MYLLPRHPSDNEVFAFCEQWLASLSAGDYDAVLDMLVPGERWSWRLIEELISNYGSLEPHRSGRRFRVTPPETATGECYRETLRVDPDDDVCTGSVHPYYPFAVYWFTGGPARNGSLGWVYLTYPLDGEWSDLSSEFDLLPHGDSIALNLDRIEVM